MRKALRWMGVALGLVLAGMPVALFAQFASQALQRAYNEALARYQHSDYRGALQGFEEALWLARERGHRRYEAVTLHYIGMVHDSLGDSASALAYYEQSLNIKREIGDRDEEAARPRPDSAAPADQGLRDNRVQARKALWVPGSDDWFELDKTSGEETIYVVATRERREDVEDLFKRHRVAAAPAPEKEALQGLSIVLKTMGVQNVSAATGVKSAASTGEAAEGVIGRLTRDGVSLARKISFRHD